MTIEDFDPVIIVVSRAEVEKGDTSGPLSTLRHLISSPEMIRAYRERLTVTFDGYNETAEKLFEIPIVRDYVRALDAEFPYWLYFVSRKVTSLQCIALCFLPPLLTDEARARIYPERLRDLIEKRWAPALNHICSAAGLPSSDADALLESALYYFANRPLPPGV
jgi:hypothetical protein